MKELESTIQSINRAIKAEIKQGYINTGAIGGFSGYMLDLLVLLNGYLTADLSAKLRTILEDYGRTSPWRRRNLLREIQEMIQEFNPGEQDDSSGKSVDSSGKTGDFAGKQVNTGNRPDFKMDSGKRTINQAAAKLQYIKGVGPYRVKQFAKIGIFNLEDLLKYYPRKYETRRKKNIEELIDGEISTISGKVVGSQVSRGRTKVVKLRIEQDGRLTDAVWFNQVYIAKQYLPGTPVTVTGKVQWNNIIPHIMASDIRKGNAGPEEEIVAVYPETTGVSSKTIRGVIKAVLPQVKDLFPEYLPENGGEDLMDRSEAFREIHIPSAQDMMIKARERLVIEEILLLQLALARLRSQGQIRKSPALNKGGELVKKFLTNFPYQLTGAQTRVIREIFQDMADTRKGMSRLLQGDVGSGKTVVAMAALLQAVGSGFQAAFMAPTEVLANQHFESLNAAFQPLGVEVVLLAGYQSKKERDLILAQIIGGQAQVIVGTQALIQETVCFHSLGIVITDEQHRFGVRQRSLLKDKGENPHVLVMTATPIPRTMALTLYGDLQLSVLNEMPAGRKPVITRKISEKNRLNLEKFLERQIAEGRQIYVVCPLVEETEKSDLVSAEQTAINLKEHFEDSRVELLHGKMKSQEKEEIMQRFRQGRIDILVATTVIEVGVNIPNASVMVVEGAERFGLAQLHQLRGRVGRGKVQSYCMLVSNSRHNARLNILCQTGDGFKIAEEDLKIRGQGELLGLRQHGLPELKLTDLSRDGELVERAYRILQKALASPEKYEKLFAEVEKVYPLNKVGVN